MSTKNDITDSGIGCTAGCGCLLSAILIMLGILLTLSYWVLSMGKCILNLFN